MSWWYIACIILHIVCKNVNNAAVKLERHDDKKTEYPTPATLTLMSTAIGLSSYIWDLSFNYGAFGTIFLGHSIAVWIFSLSVLMVMALTTHNPLPGKKWLGYLMLSLPSIWLVLRIIDDSTQTGQPIDKVLVVMSSLSILVALPYLLYLFIYFTHADLLRLKSKLIIGLVAIGLLMGVIGYTLGSHNSFIMTCQNFVVSGQDTPNNCVNEQPSH